MIIDVKDGHIALRLEGFYIWFHNSQGPRVTYEKLLHECKRHECNHALLSMTDGTTIISINC